MNTPETSSFGINMIFPFLASGLVFVLFGASLRVLVRHTSFIFDLRRHLRRFAPLYLVAGPPAVTYLVVCGAASVVSTYLFFLFHIYFKGLSPENKETQQYANTHGIYTIFHCVEYGCSFFGALGFAWLIRWVGISRLWKALLIVSLSMCAAYRTTRVGSGPEFGSGPEIVASPQWLDAIPVALGLGVYLLLFEKLKRPAPHAESL